LDDGFSVSLYTPIGRRMTIVISDDPSLWPSGIVETYYPGLLYFAVPQRSLFVGPVPLPRRLAHGNRTLVDPQLAQLEAARVDPSHLPPMRGA
jgi:hypothetical protein